MTSSAIRTASLARRERQKAETRQAILDAARELFVSDGIEATTMRAIAAKIGYTPTAIYHHFADKDALVRELVLADMSRLAAAFARAARVADPVERLQSIGMAYVRFGIEHPEHYRFLFLTPDAKQGLEEEIQCRMNEAPEQDAYHLLQVTVAEAIENGRFGPLYHDVDRVSQICWATVHGIVSLHIVFSTQPWLTWRETSVTAERMLAAMTHGMQQGATG